MQNASLLIEFLTEELPPIGLDKVFGETFTSLLSNEIQAFITPQSTTEYFVTPRRFGVVITNVNAEEPGKTVDKKGPAIATGLQDGAPTNALRGFMKSTGATDWQSLEQNPDGYFYATVTTPTKHLNQILPEALQTALKKLPIAKNMRWGSNEYSFARPVHNLMILHGSQLLCDDISILGVTPVAYTFGHRFMSEGKIEILHADEYLSKLENSGNVVASFTQRKLLIHGGLSTQAQQLGLHLMQNVEQDALIAEVTALVEYPVVLVGEFAKEFLAVPQECLILTMAKNQKYFALFDASGKLTNKFLFVANLASKNPNVIINGNQKVLVARLADAEFFYTTDKKHALEYFAEKLSSVVYHNKLGTQDVRIQRLRNIAKQIAPMLHVDPALADTAASLLKADLTTEMVGEFPELQGVMGKYYALHQGLGAEIAQAIEEHYYPRFSGDALPSTPLATVAALSDKLEILLGIWGVGLIPTGSVDPFALRRNALGIARILLEQNLDVTVLLQITYNELATYLQKLDGHNAEQLLADVYDFILQRLANYLISEKGFATNVVHAVIKLTPKSFGGILELLTVLSAFANNAQNKEFFEANKRIANILKKNRAECEQWIPDQVRDDVTSNPPAVALIDATLLTEPAEIKLLKFVQELKLPGNSVIDWQNYLSQLESGCSVLAEFFANVMVMAEDAKTRQIRLRLLMLAQEKFNYLCDMAELSSAA